MGFETYQLNVLFRPLVFNTNQTSVRYIYQISRNIYADQHAFHLVIHMILIRPPDTSA
jgi:hypothetical protein